MILSLTGRVERLEKAVRRSWRGLWRTPQWRGRGGGGGGRVVSSLRTSRTLREEGAAGIRVAGARLAGRRGGVRCVRCVPWFGSRAASGTGRPRNGLRAWRGVNPATARGATSSRSPRRRCCRRPSCPWGRRPAGAGGAGRRLRRGRRRRPGRRGPRRPCPSVRRASRSWP